MAGFYTVYHGQEGIRNIASRIHSITVFLEKSISKLGFKQVNKQYFDTLRFILPDSVSAQQIRTIALSKEVNLRYFDNGDVGLSIDETTDVAAANILLSIFAIAAGKDFQKVDDIPEATIISEELKRQTPYLTHEVFSNIIPKRNDALHQASRPEGYFIGTIDDFTRFLHHETECSSRNVTSELC